jgi:ectoine hydroxylase-related dioxygenase (phytanoyl-CoA dioxygenase family)
MLPSPLGQIGFVHLKQVLPQRLLRELRDQIRNELGFSSALGIDRQAIALHRQQPGQLQILQPRFTGLPELYELALHTRMEHLLQQQLGWHKPLLSPILNLRAKLPWRLSQSSFTTVPWHQDYGASDPTCDPVELVTAWIPLTAASPHHGGLELVPSSHRLGWLPHHRGERGPEVLPSALEEALAGKPAIRLDARPGDLVLFHQLTLHRSLPNHSSRCRWSLDLRYSAAGCSTGRPGLWSRDPRVGEGFSPSVAELVQERQQALSNPRIRIQKRVDQQP